MSVIVLLLRLVCHALFRDPKYIEEIVRENEALRRQLNILRKRRTPQSFSFVARLYRMFRKTWRSWKRALVQFRPETILAWHQK